MRGRWKRIAFVGACAALAVSVFGGAGSARVEQQRTLNIYGFGPGDDVAQTLTGFASRALGDNVEIENPRGGFNDQAFLAMLASRNVPDVVWMSRGLVGTYAARGALMPFANCIRSERIDMKQYRAAAVREVQYGGQTYGLPAFTNQITIIVNDNVARQSGVNINSISTRNWAALKRANKRMLRTEGGRVTRIGFDPKIT